jgi:hypothetical protein
LLSVGVVLLVLGTGNTIVSRNKITQYAARPTVESEIHLAGDLRDLSHLTPEINQALLQRLHRDLGDYTFVDAKLDFYRVVYTGGRFLSWIGALCIVVVIVQDRRWRRGRELLHVEPSA